MATKKSASKKTTGTEPAAEKTAAKKAPAKKTAAKKTVDVQASASDQASQPGTEARSTAKTAAKTARPHPSHHDISVRAYLLWEQDGKKHGHHDHYWTQAERELLG